MRLSGHQIDCVRGGRAVFSGLDFDAAAGEALASGKGLAGSLEAAAQAAKAGAEATKAMIATKGRASRLGERSLGHMDPGAASAVTVIEAMRVALTD